MKDNFPKFAVIGKPNNGKSTIISALTMDDRPEIDHITGTTKVNAEYDYTYKKQIVCRFFDTPGFENANKIYDYIEENKTFGNESFRKFIAINEKEKKYKKDCEILKAIIESDFIIFVVDISKEFNIDDIGYELEILKNISIPKIALLNPIEKHFKYHKNWKKVLNEHGVVNVYIFDPLKSSFFEIEEIFRSLYSIDSNLTSWLLDRLLETHKTLIRETTKESAEIISGMLSDILRHKESKKFYKEDIAQGDKDLVLDKFTKGIYEKEKKGKRKIQEAWGYHNVKIKDFSSEYDDINSQKLGWTKKKMALIGGALGLISGAAISTATAASDLGAATVLGMIGGGVTGWITGQKFHVEKVLGQDLIYTFDKKNVNVSVIILKRALEHLFILIQHGHANRSEIVIPDNIEDYKFKDWDLTKAESIKLAKMHKKLVENKDSKEIKEAEDKLTELVQDIISREIIQSLKQRII
jgi:GTP-binding protein EngB required for normal cell division